MDLYQRILGGLFGVACGDALGGTLEFMTKQEIQGKHGYLRDLIGGGCWNLQLGEVTDDTMMTIAVAEGIIENPEDPIEKIGDRFIQWYNSNPKDIGNIIRIALEEYKRTKDWTETAYYAHQQTGGMSAGNGSLMRCLPAALAYTDIDKMVEVTRAQSLLTHYDDKATRACILYNKLVTEYLMGKSKTPSIKRLLKEFSEYDLVFQISRKDLKPTGYVVDTLICALWCFVNTSTFEQAVCEAVNLGGDADTVGAITGGVAGVYYGYDAIPARWNEKLLLKDRLHDISKRIANLRQSSH